jgi:hypothetical protein
MNNSGIISMQYANDTLFCWKIILINYAINFNWILSYFKQISGMRINFRACDLGSINIGDGDA